MSRYAKNAAAWLQHQFKTYEAEPALAASFRAKQVQAVLRLTPLTLLANICNTIIICSAYWRSSNQAFLLVWSALVIGSVCVGIPAWRRWRAGRMIYGLSLRALRRAVRNAAILAVLWAALPIVLFAASDAEQRLLLVTIVTGMICAGGFALATVPQAAITYVVILSLGSAWTIGTTYPELTALLVIYSCIVIATVVATARTFGARLVAEAEADRQKELVGLLLHDFEENSSDWLWEIDRRGHLRFVPPRLAESLSANGSALLERPFVDLIAATFTAPRAEELAAIQRLRDCLNSRQPFRDVAVTVEIAGQPRWWSLTAKPLLNAVGEQIGWRGVGADITNAEVASREVNRLANYDSLTGLANRHLFRAQLERIVHAENAQSCALLFLDLDNFKLINDSLGHGVGDKLLDIVAQRLQSRIPRGDLLARIGGDEFALICWDLQHHEVVANTAMRLLDALREPCIVDGSSIQTGTSIGIALAPIDATTPDDLLKCADLALYAAKAGGRNRYRFFDKDIAEYARRRSTLQLDLHRALERGEFRLHYQPQINLQTRSVIGLEALLRWQHPSGAMISPVDFIPIAEETGLIVRIGEWVLNAACVTATQWPEPLSVSVNLSAPQFTASIPLAEVVRNALAASGLPARRLELEVTESLLIRDSKEILETLAALRAIGVRVALDDFGTGYSSLAYLRTFPLDRLKIDRAFVASLEGDRDAQAIIRAIIELAAALRLQTTAEGVETPEQLQILQNLSCMEVQGFLFAKPMAPDNINKLLCEWNFDS